MTDPQLPVDFPRLLAAVKERFPGTDPTYESKVVGDVLFTSITINPVTGCKVVNTLHIAPFTYANREQVAATMTEDLLQAIQTADFQPDQI